MSIIDEHIKETEEIISSNDQAIAKEQYNNMKDTAKAKKDGFDELRDIVDESEVNTILQSKDDK